MEVAMRPVAFLVPALLAAGIAGSASGQEVERYRLEKTETGYVRMDTTTGEMSICEERGGELVCKPAAEERTALQDEIDRLQKRLEGLEQRVASLEKRPAIPETLVPSGEQFDKTMEFMEKFFHRFMDIVRDFEKDKNSPEALPQRT
jgi:hypothetical protein